MMVEIHNECSCKTCELNNYAKIWKRQIENLSVEEIAQLQREIRYSDETEMSIKETEDN